MSTPTKDALIDQLGTLNPSHLELINESHMHSGYFEGKESHFKLIIVSECFAGLRLVARHQAVYAKVANLLTSGGGLVHALAIHAYTPDEWQSIDNAPDSPLCASKRAANSPN